MSAVLVCDSGSSKSDWWLISNGNSEHLLTSSGFNPYVHDTSVLQEILSQVKANLNTISSISRIETYCAGANNETSGQMARVLQKFFPNANCQVYSDLLAVAHGLGRHTKCWVAILGTGSNLGHYDGTQIDYQRESLGWFWGDEGSARQITKAVIVAYCRRNMNEATMNLLRGVFDMTVTQMKHYALNTPPLDVISESAHLLKDHWSHPSLREISETTIFPLLEDIARLQDMYADTVHLSGSVAYFHRNFIRKKLERLGVSCGDIVQYPIQKLINYHVARDQ